MSSIGTTNNQNTSSNVRLSSAAKKLGMAISKAIPTVSEEFDKTYTGLVVEVKENNNYIVKVEGAHYTLQSTATIPEGATVKVVVPRNNWDKMYIDFKEGGKSWYIPDWWIDLPPAPEGWNYLLVDDTEIVGFGVYNYIASVTSNLYVDWGDGSIDELTVSELQPIGSFFNLSIAHNYHSGDTIIDYAWVEDASPITPITISHPEHTLSLELLDGTRQYILKIKNQNCMFTIGASSGSICKPTSSNYNYPFLRASLHNIIPYPIQLAAHCPYFLFSQCGRLKDIDIKQNLDIYTHSTNTHPPCITYSCYGLNYINLNDMTIYPQQLAPFAYALTQIDSKPIVKICSRGLRDDNNNPYTGAGALTDCYSLAKVNFTTELLYGEDEFEDCYGLPQYAHFTY